MGQWDEKLAGIEGYFGGETPGFINGFGVENEKREKSRVSDTFLH